MEFDNGTRSKNTLGHRTTVDITRATYTTVSKLGQKRPIDEVLADSGTHPRVLSAITNQVPRNDFIRASAATQCRRLKASEIKNSSSFDSLPGQISIYSQRKTIAATPNPSADPRLSLAHPSYGLPEQLIKNFSSLGINSIYPWQANCLSGARLIYGEGNLVYTAPTGGGKSLVADVLMLKKVIDNPDKKAILVLPYVALVQEKQKWLRTVTQDVVKNSQTAQYQASVWRKKGNEESVRVVGFIGASKSRYMWNDMDIAVCTIEKANALVNSAIEECSVGNLGIVVMDELHMLDDDGRGYIMELMATKLLSLEQDIQLIGMSATLSNAELLAGWLHAKFYVSKYRPVPVQESLVFENAVYPAETSSCFFKTAAQLNSQSPSQTQAKPQPSRIIQASQHKELSNPLLNAVVALASETARAGYGALVFCSSRAGCETDAQFISQVMPEPHEVARDVNEKRRNLLSDLRSTTSGLDHTLEKTIPYGVAFHHAGLTTEERELVATAYDHGVLKVIVATCSLAAGINLPARRVILHGARQGRELVGPSMLRQMRGRAGRKGKDEVGETYMCCQKADIEAVAELMEADLPEVTSCLTLEKRGIERALLEVIATKLATSDLALDDYFKKTLLYHSEDHLKLNGLVKITIEKLIAIGLIKVDSDAYFEATLLGQAVVASALTPEDGVFVHSQLKTAAQAFVLDGEMHCLYTFTPIQSAQAEVDWRIFRREMDLLDESGLRVLRYVGIKPAMVEKLAKGGSLKETTPADLEISRVYRRFYAAFQLRDLCNEMPIYAVARKYGIARGIVQTLAQTCHGFAVGMIKFCERMGWGALAAALDHMSDRLKAGARSDLLALAQVTYVKSRTARTFWENGYKTVGALAAADVKDLVPVLLLAQPRKLRLHPEDEEKYQQKLQLKAEIIIKSASKIWERLMQEEFDEE